jgi:pimeloyl-ACP methyl ester carboxylesterase
VRSALGGPGTGLHTHIEDVVAVLEIDDLQDVVLVGHSSGGAVVRGVALLGD